MCRTTLSAQLDADLRIPPEYSRRKVHKRKKRAIWPPFGVFPRIIEIPTLFEMDQSARHTGPGWVCTSAAGTPGGARRDRPWQGKDQQSVKGEHPGQKKIKREREKKFKTRTSAVLYHPKCGLFRDILLRRLNMNNSRASACQHEAHRSPSSLQGRSTAPVGGRAAQTEDGSGLVDNRPKIPGLQVVRPRPPKVPHQSHRAREAPRLRRVPSVVLDVDVGVVAVVWCGKGFSRWHAYGWLPPTCNLRA